MACTSPDSPGRCAESRWASRNPNSRDRYRIEKRDFWRRSRANRAEIRIRSSPPGGPAAGSGGFAREWFPRSAHRATPPARTAASPRARMDWDQYDGYETARNQKSSILISVSRTAAFTAWLLLCAALAAHIGEEAATGFLDLWNPEVASLG